jgi:hypothetical protein
MSLMIDKLAFFQLILCFIMKLILPKCIKEVQLSSLHGRKIAIDASMAIYQFLIAVRSGGPNTASAMLTNAEGETTSHIQVNII